MSPIKRIIVNTVASYGQSVFAIIVTLFSARWILMALGESDFGLFGVVGSLTLLINFLSGGLSVGVSRFYAFSIGAMKSEAEDVPEDDLTRWFNTAFSIHLIVPVLFVCIGWPIGSYAIQNWLTIPVDRIDACLVVFRMSLVTTAVMIFAVPFVSMFRAHQYIFELAIFGVLRMIAVLAVAWALLHVESDRLIAYAVAMMVIAVVIQLLQVLRACIKFEACRVRFAYLYDFDYMKRLFAFVGWKMFGMGCVAIRTQGAPVLVNLFYGPLANAAYSIANRVSIQATTLSAAMTGAFQPALVSAEGSGDRAKAISMSMQVCKFGALMVLCFAIPLILEMQTLLDLWLVHPPRYAVELCQWMTAMLVVDRLTCGPMLVINAYGKIALYELVQGSLFLLALVLIWVFYLIGLGLPSVGTALFLSVTLYCCGRLMFAKNLLDYPVAIWLRQVLLPVVALILFSTACGYVVLAAMQPGLLRLMLTSGLTLLCSSLFAWFLLMSATEKSFVINRIQRKFPKLTKTL